MGKPLRTVARALSGQKAHYIGNIRFSGVGVDEDTVTIGGLVYHLNNGTAAATGEIDVDISGDQAATAVVDALVTEINANHGTYGIFATDNSDEIVLTSRKPFTLAESLTNGTVDPATAAGGNAYADIQPVVMITRVPTAAEVTAGELKIYMEAPVTQATVLVRVTATDVVKAWDGATTISGNTITLGNGGSTDWAATDDVIVTVQTAPTA